MFNLTRTNLKSRALLLKRTTECALQCVPGSSPYSSLPVYIFFSIHLTPHMRNAIALTARQTRKNVYEVTLPQTFPPPSVAVICRENWALVSLSSFRRVETVPLKTKGRNVPHQLITKTTASLVGISRVNLDVLSCSHSPGLDLRRFSQ